jgi:hypothetical protein
MQLTAQHEIDAPLSLVIGSLLRADYATYLASHHGFFREIEVLGLNHDHQGRVLRRVRYRAQPPFTHLGPVSIPRSWFIWTERSCLDLRTNVLSFDNVPERESIRAKVVNRGTMSFSALSENKCMRRAVFEIDLLVSKAVRPLVELGVELIAKQVANSLDTEARVLANFCQSARPSLNELSQRTDVVRAAACL